LFVSKTDRRDENLSFIMSYEVWSKSKVFYPISKRKN